MTTHPKVFLTNRTVLVSKVFLPPYLLPTHLALHAPGMEHQVVAGNVILRYFLPALSTSLLGILQAAAAYSTTRIWSYLVTGSTARFLILHKEFLTKFFAAILAPGAVDWLTYYFD